MENSRNTVILILYSTVIKCRIVIYSFICISNLLILIYEFSRTNNYKQMGEYFERMLISKTLMVLRYNT